ncbi:MAG TPA: cytochrome c oxidase subunit II [Phenylobacterium sp.]|jgi:cytochrome c oxidase subunit 2|nr:cytochrome c oxidase subunit II [Phenylobacterium sp.]
MRRLSPIATGLLALPLAACRGVQTMLDPAGDQAAHIQLIWRAMLIVCGLMYILVLGFLAWALLRARARRAADDAPIAGETAAEPMLARGLTGWVALIVAGLITLTTVSFLVDRSIAEVGPDPLKIKVTANQWWWDVEYQGATPSQNVTTANELHLPLGRPAVIQLQANDVIHSFWVPNLAGKTDLIPGRTNYMAVTPRRLGVFRGQCAEFCGFQHAKMAFDVHVDTPQAFAAWEQARSQPAAAPTSPETVHGREVFTAKACVLCHRVDGTSAAASVGPDLTHLASREHIAAGALPNDAASLAGWIADPQGVKPGTTMPQVPLTAQELTDVVAYLETLK